MEITKLWDIQTLAYGLMSVVVVIFVLIILAIMSRRVRNLTSEMDSVRRELALLEEGIATVNASLKSHGKAMAAATAQNEEVAAD